MRNSRDNSREKENTENIDLSTIDYKDVQILRKFISPYGKILPRKKTGINAKNQRELANAIKRARFMGLLPYIAR